MKTCPAELQYRTMEDIGPARVCGARVADGREFCKRHDPETKPARDARGRILPGAIPKGDTNAPHPFAHVSEQYRPQLTDKVARHGAPIYWNPAIREHCAYDKKTGFIYGLPTWEKVCTEREREAGPDLLAALESISEAHNTGWNSQTMEFNGLFDKARAAIAKAKGAQ